VSPALLQELAQLQKELSELQMHASQMAEDNSPLADQALLESRAMMKYIQDLQHFKHRLESCVISFEAAYKQILGKMPRRGAKRHTRHRDLSGLGGLSMQERMRRARSEVTADMRPFRQRAVDVVASFHERQLAMLDMQRELQVFLAQANNAKADHTLSTVDARVLSARENVIQQALSDIVRKLGGKEYLVRIPEEGDDEVLAQLVATRELMLEYCKDVKRQLARRTRLMKRRQKHARMNRAPRSRRSKDSKGSLTAGARGRETLTENLRSFGSNQPGSSRPFAWFRTDGHKISVAGRGPSVGLDAFGDAGVGSIRRLMTGASAESGRQPPTDDPKWSWAEPIYDPGDGFLPPEASDREL